MEFLLKKISHFISLYYKFIVFAFTLLIVISTFTVFKMEIKTDIIDVLPKGNSTVTQFRDFMEKYGALDYITIAIESDNNSIEDHIDLIEDIAEKLKKIPLIEYVDYSTFAFSGMYQNTPLRKHFPLLLDENGLKQFSERLTKDGIERQIKLNHQKLISPFSSPIESELIAKDPLNLSEIIIDSLKRSNRDSGLDTETGYYFTKDHSMALIFAKPTGKSRDMIFVKRLRKEIDTIIASSINDTNKHSGINIMFTGSHIFAEEARKTIKHDITSSFIISVILIAFLIWLVYRVRVAVLAAIGLTLLASLSMTLAFAYLLFGSLNIVTSIVAAVLIGLYVDYSMHILKRYGDELRERSDRQIAMEVTLTKTGTAFVVSALTTSLSFFSILVTRFEGLYELGIVSGIGVLFCLVSNLFLMSSLLFWISKNGFLKIFSVERVSFEAEGLINFIKKKPQFILFSGAILIALLGFGISKLHFDDNPEHIGIKDSQALTAIRAINQKINKSGEPLHIIIKRKNMEDLTTSFDTLEKLLSVWRKDGIIGRYDSVGLFIPPPYIQKKKIEILKEMTGKNLVQKDKIEKIMISTMEKNNFAYEKNYIDAYLNGIITALNQHEIVSLKELETVSDPRLGYFYNKSDTSIAAHIYPVRKDWDEHSLKVIHDGVKSVGLNWAVVGRPFLFREIRSSIIWGSTLATIVAFLCNIMILYMAFKKILHVALLMLPVTLGFLFTIGVMGYINTPFNFINIGIVALIFGFGVDYGVYVMQAYLREEKKDITNALRLTGKNVFMCAATTIAGCGSLVTAKFAGIASMGLTLTIGAIFCSLTALLILPSILYLKQDKC